MYSAEQVIMILRECAHLSGRYDTFIKDKMLYETWDGQCHSADEVIAEFLRANDISFGS